MRRQILENVPDPVSPLFEDLYLISGIKKVRMLNGFAYMPFRRTTSTSARRVKRSDDGNSQKASIEMAAKEKHDMEMFVAQLLIDDLARFNHFNRVAGELNSQSLAHLLTNPDDARWNLRLATEDLDPMVEGFHVARKPAYLAKIGEWRDVEKSTASNEKLLAGMRELAAPEASYWFDGPKAKGSGLGGRTTHSNSLTLAASKVTDRRLQIFLDQHLPGFTSGHFLTGFKSKPMQATHDAYEIAKRIRANDELCELVIAFPVSRLMSELRMHPGSGPVLNAIDQYLDTYGHHGATLDFVEPTLREDPTPLFATLRNMVVDPDYDPRQHEVVAERTREAALKEVERCLEDLAYWQFRFRLWFASRYYPVREEVTFYLGSAWPVLRSIALELGGRLVKAGTLANANDVFYLDGTELRDALGAPESQESSGYCRLTAHRRDLREARKRLHPPGTIPPEARQDAIVGGIETQTCNDPASATLKGVPVSAGSVTGVVSVIRSAAEFGQMKPGSILVCAMTNPAWTPLFAHATGLVTDIGGILAHGSVVAREYGIPAVLGTGNITERVKSGDRINSQEDSKARLTASGSLRITSSSAAAGPLTRRAPCSHLR